MSCQIAGQITSLIASSEMLPSSNISCKSKDYSRSKYRANEDYFHV